MQTSRRFPRARLAAHGAALLCCGAAANCFALAVVTDWDDPLLDHQRTSITSVVQGVRPAPAVPAAAAAPAAKPVQTAAPPAAAHTTPARSDAGATKLTCPKSDAAPADAATWQTAAPRPPRLDRPAVNTMRHGL